ncbi:MAG: hypothetical protein ACLQMG_08630 [Terracidiphilus sp.]
MNIGDTAWLMTVNNTLTLPAQTLLKEGGERRWTHYRRISGAMS